MQDVESIGELIVLISNFIHFLLARGFDLQFLQFLVFHVFVRQRPPQVGLEPRETAVDVVLGLFDRRFRFHVDVRIDSECLDGASGGRVVA